MIEYMIPLLSSWLPLWHTYLVPVLCLCFVAWCGTFVHSLLRR